MPKLETWSAPDAHFAAIAGFQAWSKSSPRGAMLALRQVLTAKGQANLVDIVDGDL